MNNPFKKPEDMTAPNADHVDRLIATIKYRTKVTLIVTGAAVATVVVGKAVNKKLNELP